MYMNKKTFIKKLLPYIIPIPLIFLLFLFVLTQKGPWFYLDAGYELVQNQSKMVLSQFFHTFTTQTYFGYDPSYITPPRLLWVVLEYVPKAILGAKTGFVFYLFTSFYIAFLFTFKSLRFEHKITPSLFGALIFIFNPFSINQISVPGFSYVLFGLPMLFYSVSYYMYNRKFNFFSYLITVIGLYSVLSYPRILGVTTIFLAFFFLFHASTILRLLNKDWRRITIYAGFLLLSVLPIITTLFLYVRDVRNDNGAWGYQNYAVTLSKLFCEWVRSRGFISGSILNEVTSNFGSEFQSSLLFVLVSVFFIFFILLMSFNSKKSSDIKFFTFFILFSIFIKTLPLFVDYGTFKFIIYSVLPFLILNVDWISYPLAFSLSFLVANILQESTKITRKMVYLLIVTYIFISLYPLIYFKNNNKLATLDMGEIPVIYRPLTINIQTERVPSLFFPSTSLLLKWSPYPINLAVATYIEPLSSNPRIVDERQSRFYKYLYDKDSVINYSNLIILNIKDFFFFTELSKEIKGFDYTSALNSGVEFLSRLQDDSNLYVNEGKDGLLHYKVISSNEINNLIYIPDRIVLSSLNDFLTNEIDTSTLPVFLDTGDIQSNFDKYLNSNNGFNKQVSLFVKYSDFDPTHYYLHVRDVDESQLLLVHLNRSFNLNWKILEITRERFESIRCLDDWKHFEKSKNYYCEFHSPYINLNYVDMITKKPLNFTHLPGNFVGNTWIIDQYQSINTSSDKYYFIYYDKQPYYSIALLVSFITILFGIIVLLVKVIIVFLRRRGHI